MTPREFVEARKGAKQLATAVRQQKQIQYLTMSSVQDDLRYDYFDKYAEAKYSGEDPLLQWVYSLFKKDNFKSFYKYLRFPVISSSICKNEIQNSLERVFFADDSYQKFVVNGKEVPEPEFLNEKEFLQQAFEAVLYRFNDVVIHDMKGVNLPYRTIVEIDSVDSIEVTDNQITKIAYKSKLDINGVEEDGHTYLDSEVFAFVPNNEALSVIEVPHDIKRCPANFIVEDKFKHDEPIVREGIYSRVRPLLEQYVFLSTLQLMSDSNGAFPVIVKLAEDSIFEDENTQHENLHPMSAESLGHKKARMSSGIEAGDVTELDVVMKADGSLDTSFIDNYIRFFRTPVDSLNYINQRVEALRKRIVETVVGDFVEQSEESKNELQVSKSYLLKQDKLRYLGRQIDYCMSNSDEIMLKLAHGANCWAYRSSGTDFFIETIDDLFKQVTQAPNPIEKANVIHRITRIRGINNNERSQRDCILYKIIPFMVSSDFEKALSLKLVTNQEILLQTRFSYFINNFESMYGDVVELWNSMAQSDNEKLIFFKNLLNQIIKDYEEQNQNSSHESDEVPIGT